MIDFVALTSQFGEAANPEVSVSCEGRRECVVRFAINWMVAGSSSVTPAVQEPSCACPGCITELAIPPGKVTTLLCSSDFSNGCSSAAVFLKAESAGGAAAGGKFKVTTYGSPARTDVFPDLSTGNKFVGCFTPGHGDVSSGDDGSARSMAVIDVQCESNADPKKFCTIVSGKDNAFIDGMK